MANGSDGQIKIDTTLDSSQAKKGLQDIQKKADQAGKQITQSMNNAENAMKKATSAFDGAKIAKQLDTVGKSIDNTNTKIELQQHKLEVLQAAYNKAMNPVQKNKIAEQIANTEGKIISLQSKMNTLKDKQVNLKIKIDGTETIDNSTKEIEKDMDNISQKAKVTQDEINKVLNIKPSNTNAFTKIGENISSAGEKISSFGDTLDTHVTIPVAAMAAASTKSAADFEHQMADIAKEVKAKGEDVDSTMSQMSADSMKWSEDFGQSTDDINKGFLILVKDGYSGAESMNIMETALKTARGANEDLFTVIDQLGGSLEAYQQKTDNATQTTSNMAHMADTFAYIANHTKASIVSLGEGFATVGQTASALGIPMEQTAAAIGVLESSNIDANIAATSLKAGLVNLTKPTKQMRAAMAEMGLQAFDSNGKMKDLSTILNDIQKGTEGWTLKQKEAALAATFGKESLASWTTLVNRGGDYLKNLADNAGNATGEVDELSNSMANTPVNKMKEFEASAKTLGITFGEDLLPALTPIIDDLTEMLKSFSNLDEGTRKNIIDFALFAAAIGPVAKLIGGTATSIGTLIKLGGKFTGFVSKLGAAGEATSAAATGAAAAGEATATGAGVAAAAEGATVAAGGFAAAATAAAPFILALAAVAAGGYVVYKGMSQQVVPSVDLFADKVNTTTETVQTQYGAMQQAVVTGVTKISDSTKKAVQSYLDMDNDSRKYLQELYVDGTTITDNIVSDSKSKFDKMAQDTINGYEKQKNDGIKKLQDLFSQEKDITADEQADIVKKTNDYYSNKENKVKEDEEKITEIMQKASGENRSLTSDELQEIQGYQNDMRDNAVSALSQQESETAVILQRMKDYNGEITAEQASEQIKNLNSARDQAIQAANDQYDQTVATVSQMRDDIGSITSDQADQMIADAGRQRNETIQKAEETRDGAVQKITEMDSNISSDVDTTTGNILTNWDKLVNWWNSWEPQVKNFVFNFTENTESAYQNSSNTRDFFKNLFGGQQNNYTGSNNPHVGLSYVNEHGYETAKSTNIKMLNPGLAYISSHATGGDGINDHMTTVNEMHNDITNQVNNSLGAIINSWMNYLTGQNNILNTIATNTGNTVSETQKGNQLNQQLATDVISNLKTQTTGNFSGLQNEINSATTAKTKADNMKIEDNYWYSSSKQQLDDITNQMQDIENENTKLNAQKEESFDKSTNKDVSDYNKEIELQVKENEAKKAALEEQKQDLQDSVAYYKQAAQQEIDTAKQTAQQEVDIANQKKEQLTKIADAVTTAIKNQLSEQETAAEDSINSQLTVLEDSYNKKVAALEQQSTDTSRQDTIDSSNQNIDFLKNEMNNTASYADRQALALKIKDAKSSLQKQQDEWDIEDQKKALEDEYNAQKTSLEKQLSDTKDYYSKLQEEDSVNAQARYALLNDNSDQLVQLLNSYNPQWQDAGQSLADSLINGLNSQQQSVQDAVNDLVSLRGASQSYYYNEKGQKVSYSTGQVITGYATGTNSNSIAGLYKTNENGFEMSTNGNVAYVSQGAAITNHMQTQSYIDSLVATEVSNLKASLIQSQQDTIKSMFNSLSGNSGNVVNKEGNSVNFIVQGDYVQNTDSDIKTTAYALGYYANTQRTN